MAKRGAKYKCDECGLVVVVDDPCGCSMCDLVCCGELMKEVKSREKVTGLSLSFSYCALVALCVFFSIPL